MKKLFALVLAAFAALALLTAGLACTALLGAGDVR